MRILDKYHRWSCRLGVLSLLSAAASGSAAAGQVVSDSADAWLVGGQPVRVYGGAHGGIDGEFVSIVDVAFGPDGSVAIADQDLGTVTVFSPEGDVLTSFGRFGEGPGEFGLIAGLVSGPGGNLFVLDQLQHRVSEWTVDGELVGDRRVELEDGARPVGAMGRFPGGGWYVLEANRIQATAVGEVAEDTVRFFRLYENVVRDQLAEVRGMATTQYVIEGVVGVRRALFSPSPLGIPLGNCLLVGTTDVPTFRLVDEIGGDKGELHFDVNVEPARKAHREEWLRTAMAEIESEGVLGPNERRSLAALGEQLQMAPRIPFAENIIVGSRGYIWVRSYQLPEGAGSADWRVFAEDGRTVSSVEMPEGHHVVAIRENEIFAVGTDDLGREELRVFGLDRRGNDIRRLPPPGCRHEMGPLRPSIRLHALVLSLDRREVATVDPAAFGVEAGR